MSSKVKEVFIIVLLFVVIIFTVGVLFYDCIPQGGTNLETKEYVADKEVTKVLNEIKETTGIDVTENNKDSLIKSYSIGKDDLAEFATENYYESGKKDPFAEYSAPVEEEVVKTTIVTGGDVNNTQTKNEVPENKNTVANTTTNTNTVMNSVQNTNTAENKTENSNVTKEEVKEKSTGSYFEKKNSK